MELERPTDATALARARAPNEPEENDRVAFGFLCPFIIILLNMAQRKRKAQHEDGASDMRIINNMES